MLRKLNSLYLVASSLQETSLREFPADLLWVSMTPDGKQIIVETLDTADATVSKKVTTGRVRIEFLDRASLAVQRVVKSDKPVN